MAQSAETGDPTVSADNPIADLLAAPLSPDWTVEGLAEQVLGAIAADRSEEGRWFILDAGTAMDRQSRRLLRPLLACLATKSAAEAGTPGDLYGGSLSFKRPGPDGPVWIIGQFENRPEAVRVVFRRSSSLPQNSDRTAQPPAHAGASSPLPLSQVDPSRPAEEAPSAGSA
jgi:hypothetical protein